MINPTGVIRSRTRDGRPGLWIALLALAILALGVVRVDAQPTRWITVTGKSRVSFEASFSLGDFTGQTENVAGDFFGDPSNLRQGVTGVLRISAATLRTGIDGRDRDMWRALAVERHPEIRFTVEGVDSSFPSVADRSDVLLTISGVIRIHGVERSMVFPGRVRLRDDQLWVRGESRLKMSDFDIEPPRKLLLQVGNSVLVSFDLLLARESAR